MKESDEQGPRDVIAWIPKAKLVVNYLTVLVTWVPGGQNKLTSNRQTRLINPISSSPELKNAKSLGLFATSANSSDRAGTWASPLSSSVSHVDRSGTSDELEQGFRCWSHRVVEELDFVSGVGIYVIQPIASRCCRCRLAASYSYCFESTEEPRSVSGGDEPSPKTG